MRASSSTPANHCDGGGAIFDAALVVGRPALDSPRPLVDISPGHVERIKNIEGSPLAEEVDDASAEFRRAQVQVANACEQWVGPKCCAHLSLLPVTRRARDLRTSSGPGRTGWFAAQTGARSKPSPSTGAFTVSGRRAARVPRNRPRPAASGLALANKLGGQDVSAWVRNADLLDRRAHVAMGRLLLAAMVLASTARLVY